MPFSVRLVVDKMTMGQVSYRVLQFFTVSIIPPVLHTQNYLNIILFRMTSKRGLGIFKQSNALSVIREQWTAKYFNISCSSKG